MTNDLALTPDSVRYIKGAVGVPLPRPFSGRWLIPWLCGVSSLRWQIAAYTGVALTAAGTGLLAHRWEIGLAAGIMAAALPSSLFNLSHPVLIDAPAMGLAVMAAVASAHGLWPIAVVLALASGAAKETGPVFAALYAWNPLLLVGLLAPAVLAVVRQRGPDVLDEKNAWILQHPIRASREYHHGQWLDGLVMVAPWGGAIVGLVALDWRLGAVLVVAYAQLAIATDSVRLYQWAAPSLCLAACAVVPVAWLPVLVVAVVWNPLRGNGI